MNRFGRFSASAWSFLVVTAFAFMLSGCEGSDGAAGAPGVAGPVGPVGPAGPPGPVPDEVAAAIESAKVESCGTCHDGAGDMHQAEYAKYGGSALDLTITGLAWNAGTLTLNFSIDQNGAPLIDTAGAPPTVDAISFYVVQYDSATGLFSNSGGFFPSLDPSLAASNGNGTYTLTQALAYDPTAFSGGAIVGKIANDLLAIEEDQYNPAAGKRVQMYAEQSSDAWLIGDIATFESVANVDGCAACHGAPYRKHGNIDAAIAGAPDFLQCKACHSDDRTGGHEDWQYMVDDPLGWATGVAPTADYAYQAVLMNDTHMSHAMEFPYPQSMANCSTCHAGKLTEVLADANFTVETCKSCHVVEGINAWPEDAGTTLEGLYAQPHRPPPMEYLWTAAGVESFHSIGLNCLQCHGTAGFTGFADLHSGYDDHIYDANGVKYADLNTVAIDSVSLAGNLLTVEFSANNVDIVPEVLVSLYGWDTKNFIVASHTSDGSLLCLDRRGNPGGCRMEFAPGDTNALWTEDAGSVAGDWMVTLDLGAYAPNEFLPEDIPTMIANGKIKKAEVTITPELELGGQDVVLKAVDETFDFVGNATVADYFKGANATVSVEKCNACHDSLASTFHDGSGRGGDGIEVCKNCHVTTSPGSHLELASRAIDSYVHAIHSFQPFDEDDVAAANDPVFNARNEMHKTHKFPNFTALSCEGCHLTGTYNAPDQSKSMFGVLRASWDIPTRNIGTIPEAVTGPASRACGGCHRVEFINKDLAGELATFNAHTEAFGTLEENDADDLVLYGIIDKIMSMF